MTILAKRRASLLTLAVLLPLLFSFARSRLVSTVVDPTLSDGRDSSLLLRMVSDSNSSSDVCEQTYGFMPCTKSVVGNLFLMVAYGYLMLQAATCLSDGSELLLEILGTGIIGGLFLPVLGALPDAMLILVSGLSGSKDTAQQQVLIGMGLLAGSTVMLLTVLWGSCVVVGKCDLSENFTSIDSQDTRGFSLFGSGISTDLQTSYAARIMVISVIPFIIVQLPSIFKSNSGGSLSVLFALIVALILLLSYCLYQVFQPWLQRRRLAYARYKLIISGILRHAQKQGLGWLLTSDGLPNKPVLHKLFRQIDLDSDNSISHSELQAFLLGVKFDKINLDRDDAVNRILEDFDTSGDGTIDFEEFIRGMTKWLFEAKNTISHAGTYSMKFMHEFYQQTEEDHEVLLEEIDEAFESVENPTWVIFKALSLLVLGTVVAAMFADPLVDAVHNFSGATHIPSFFISFIAMPFATNSSEAVSSIIFVSRKKKRTSSLTFSQIYGAATMNNTLCLAVFLSLVYFRNLNWDFSSEVLIILIVCVVMGLFASFRTTFQLWTCSVAFLLYPFSLVLVYVLDYVYGWT